MRLFVRFFLFFMFLLLGGYHSLYPSAAQEQVYARTNQHLTEHYDPSYFIKVQNEISPTVHEGYTYNERKKGIVEDSEDNNDNEDDDDNVTSKKVTRNPFAHLYNVRKYAYNSRNLQQRLPFCEHLSYSASFSYITLRVIRI